MLRCADTHRVDVDMVPYIDIITLLLMFLVFVGDMARNATAVKMKLPKASQAEKEIGVSAAGRIVLQLDRAPDGVYHTVVEGHRYALAPGGVHRELSAYLQEQTALRVAREQIKLGAHGEAPFPVKLRIPDQAPMHAVEKLIFTCARAGLVNVHYAAAPPDPAPLRHQ